MTGTGVKVSMDLCAIKRQYVLSCPYWFWFLRIVTSIREDFFDLLLYDLCSSLPYIILVKKLNDIRPLWKP